MVNGREPPSLNMALAIDTDRDCFVDVEFVADERLRAETELKFGELKRR